MRESGATIFEISQSCGLGDARVRQILAGVMPGERFDPEVVERTKKILDMRTNGHTLQEIGNAFSLSRERIRQILLGSGINPDVARISRRAEQNQILSLRATRLVSHLRHHPGQSWDQIAAALDETVDNLRACASPHLSSLVQPYRDREQVKAYTDNEMLDALRRAETLLGSPLTVLGYMRARADGTITGPSTALFSQRFGSWAEACSLAGVTSVPASREYTRRWSEADLLTICTKYVISGGRPSYGAIETWLRTRPDLPSVMLIRQRFHTWAEVRQRVMNQLEPHDEFWAGVLAGCNLNADT